MGQCRLCGSVSSYISQNLGVCLNCIRTKTDSALKVTDAIHEKTRLVFNLPSKPPQNEKGLRCNLCANNCKIDSHKKGFCGLTENRGGKLERVGGTPEKGILEWYYDPLPTNCVAWWFCPGCTGRGYPKYACQPHAEIDKYNLAVFYGSCSFDCLFCQNWHYRENTKRLSPTISAEDLARKATEKVSCICFFGGDPSTQMPHALATSKIALKDAKEKGRILRICWETNGNWNINLALKAVELSFQSGGIVKFDLKTWSEEVNLALCGVSNKNTLENFRIIGEKYFNKRLEVPILMASTLLVPGYVDEVEVEGLAKYIASIDSRIPYTLLAFHPCYIMNDLPCTSRELTYTCYKIAKKYLANVKIGNVHLLS
jgi:pyruvate formate lyase activating enzyme